MRTQQLNRAYQAALYLRLSKDDEGAGESSSISTQRSILQEYAKTHGLSVAGEYVDDGYSGTNYDRPAFQRMIADIEAGKINCVLTKDLSRLGRNGARTADLLDEYFPAKRVRYISVIDGYDSFNLTSGTAMTASIMAVMHEVYARDISNKIRTSFNAKMEKGEYVASFAPYGYKKDPGNKNHLVVDCQVSHIVQEIFQMAYDGYSPGEIAEHLNCSGVATPAMYRCQSRPYLDLNNYSQRKEWTSSIVCKMLKNEVYLGKTLQGKTSKVSFKSKVTQANPRDEWIVVEGTHEPLITDEMFQVVRKRSVSRRHPPTKGFHNIFAGIAVCADCGRHMTSARSRKKGATCNLACVGYRTYGARECTNHSIDYDLLCDAVLGELKIWLSLSEKEKADIVHELEKEASDKFQANSTEAAKTVSEMEQRIREVTVLMKRLYEDSATGRISGTVYQKLTAEYDAEILSLERSIGEVNARLKPDTATSEAYQEFFSLLENVTEPQALTKPLLQKLIDRIEVEQGHYTRDDDGKRYKRQKIRIYYRFIGCVDGEEKSI